MSLPSRLPPAAQEFIGTDVATLHLKAQSSCKTPEELLAFVMNPIRTKYLEIALKYYLQNTPNIDVYGTAKIKKEAMDVENLRQLLLTDANFATEFCGYLTNRLPKLSDELVEITIEKVRAGLNRQTHTTGDEGPVMYGGPTILAHAGDRKLPSLVKIINPPVSVAKSDEVKLTTVSEAAVDYVSGQPMETILFQVEQLNAEEFKRVFAVYTPIVDVYLITMRNLRPDKIKEALEKTIAALEENPKHLALFLASKTARALVAEVCAQTVNDKEFKAAGIKNPLFKVVAAEQIISAPDFVPLKKKIRSKHRSIKRFIRKVLEENKSLKDIPGKLKSAAAKEKRRQGEVAHNKKRKAHYIKKVVEAPKADLAQALSRKGELSLPENFLEALEAFIIEKQKESQEDIAKQTGLDPSNVDTANHRNTHFQNGETAAYILNRSAVELVQIHMQSHGGIPDPNYASILAEKSNAQTASDENLAYRQRAMKHLKLYPKSMGGGAANLTLDEGYISKTDEADIALKITELKEADRDKQLASAIKEN